MVKPTLNDLHYVGFSTGFVIRDKPGNIFYKLDPLSSGLAHAQNPLRHFSTTNLKNELPHADVEKVRDFLRDINNYSGTVIPAP